MSQFSVYLAAGTVQCNFYFVVRCFASSVAYKLELCTCNSIYSKLAIEQDKHFILLYSDAHL